jgi:hypothetical protein
MFFVYWSQTHPSISHGMGNTHMVLQNSLQVESPYPHRLSYDQTDHATCITIIVAN